MLAGCTSTRTLGVPHPCRPAGVRGYCCTESTASHERNRSCGRGQLPASCVCRWLAGRYSTCLPAPCIGPRTGPWSVRTPRRSCGCERPLCAASGPPCGVLHTVAPDGEPVDGSPRDNPYRTSSALGSPDHLAAVDALVDV